MGRRTGQEDPSRWQGQHIVNEDELSFHSDVTAKRRQRKRQNIVFAVLASLVVVAFVAAGLVYAGYWPGTSKKTEAAPSAQVIENAQCPENSFAYLDPTQVRVRVLNTTSISGFGSQAATKLKERGFQITSTTESSSDYSTKIGAIVAGPQGYAQALTLQRHIPGAVFVFDKSRKDDRLDFEVGEQFIGLEKDRKLNATPGKLTCAKK